ncbi:hypothetical protein [Flagellimonas oceanensis]
MKNLEALKKWTDTIIKIGPYVIVFEVIIGAVMAIASSQVKAVDSLWFGILIFSIVVFAALNILKYVNEKNFPKLLIENLENEINKENISKSFARKSLINDAIASTLVGLNDQTCKLTNQADPYYASEEVITNRMCEKDIEDGIFNLLSPFINNLHLVLESFDSKYTIATYLKDIASETPEQDEIEYNTGIFVLKDDLNIRESLDQDLLERNDLKSEKQEIQNILRLSLNNNRFEKGKFQIEVEDFHLLSSTIPIVCDDEHPDGLFIVIGRDLKSIPNDTEEIFRIFNRVLANWISKYNECVYSRISKKE